MPLPNYAYTPSGSTAVTVVPGVNAIGSYVTLIASTIAPLDGLQVQLEGANVGVAYLVYVRINGVVSQALPTSRLGTAHLYINFPVKIPAGALIEMAANGGGLGNFEAVLLQITPQIAGATGIVNLGPVTSTPSTSGVTVAVGSGVFSIIGTTAQAWKGFYVYQGWNNLGAGRISQGYEIEVWTGVGAPTQKLMGWLSSSSGTSGFSTTDLQGPFLIPVASGTQLWMRCNAATPDPTHSVNCQIVGLTGPLSGLTTVAGGPSISVANGSGPIATVSLVNDAASPGNSQYYGTNTGGTKGYHALPTPGVGVAQVAAGFGIAVANPTGPTATVSDPWQVYANIMDYDPTGTANQGAIDATPAYDAARAAIGNQGTVYFPPGFYRGAFTIPTPYLNLRGAGMQSSILRPLTATGTVITMTNALLGIEPCYISDLKIEGVGSFQGIGIDMIQGAGHVIVQRCYLSNPSFPFDKCVSRPFGNFGFWSIDSQYGDANYHFYNIGFVDSHSGAFVVTRGRRKGARLASYYLDSDTVQTGQIVFENGVVENNPGYAYFCKNANDATVAVPVLSVNSEWNEGNATSGSITVGGVTAAPVWGYFRNTPAVQVTDTPLAEVVLLNGTNMLTYNCDISFMDPALCTIDASSTLTHERFRTEANSINAPGFTVSTQGRMVPLAGGSATWFNASTLSAVGPGVLGGTVDLVNNCSAPVTFTGSATVNTTNVSERGINGLATVQQLVMTGAQTLNSPFGAAGTPPGGSYTAIIVVARLVSGTAPTMSIDGGNTATIGRVISNGDYATMISMAQYVPTLNFLQLRFVSTASCTVNIAGWLICHFATRQACINFVNDRTFPG